MKIRRNILSLIKYHSYNISSQLKLTTSVPFLWFPIKSTSRVSDIFQAISNINDLKIAVTTTYGSFPNFVSNIKRI